MRDDLKLAAFAVALGYSLSLDRSDKDNPLDPDRFRAHKGVPADGLQFERAGVHVWDTARGWRVAKLQGDRFPRPEPGDFHRSLFTALEAGVKLGGSPALSPSSRFAVRFGRKGNAAGVMVPATFGTYEEAEAEAEHRRRHGWACVVQVQ